MTEFVVIVGGSPQARQRWPARTYKCRRSARRRAAQIGAAHDFGVCTVWIYREERP